MYNLFSLADMTLNHSEKAQRGGKQYLCLNEGGVREPTGRGYACSAVALLLRLSPSTYFSHCRGFPLIAMSHLLQHFLGVAAVVSSSLDVRCIFAGGDAPAMNRHIISRSLAFVYLR